MRRPLSIGGWALLVALALLLSPALAWAECAWVLWVDAVTVVGRGAISWNIISATSAEAECLRLRRQKLKEATSTGPPSHGLRYTAKMADDGTVTQESYRGDEIVRREIIRFLCLPDTVDPRGPKSGQR